MMPCTDVDAGITHLLDPLRVTDLVREVQI